MPKFLAADDSPRATAGLDDARFVSYLQSRHGLTPQDVELTESKGYWRIKAPCGGRAGGCQHPIHGTLFNDAGCHHTVSYHDPVRVNGRFASPYRTWSAQRARASHVTPAG